MITTPEEAMAQLNITSNGDYGMLMRKIAAAQNYLESCLGYEIESVYGGADQKPVPPALVEAVLQLVGHWYENREATLVGVSAQQLPYGVSDIIREYRRWWSTPDGE